MGAYEEWGDWSGDQEEKQGKHKKTPVQINVDKSLQLGSLLT